LPCKLTDTTNAWKTQFQEQDIDDPLTKDHQEDVFQSGVRPKLPSGWFMGTERFAGNEIFEMHHGEEDISYELIELALLTESKEMYHSHGQVCNEPL
jgi:hypothetical protein